MRLIVALWLVAEVLSQNTPSVGEKQQQPATNKEQPAKQSPSQVTEPARSAIPNPSAQKEENRPSEQPKTGIPDRWDIYWPTVGLLVVGLIAAYIALVTLNDIKEQTKNARTAAEAAKASADAVIHSERAWILMERMEREYLIPIERQTTRKATAYPVLKNFGKTIARMTAWKIELQMSDSWERPDGRAYDLTGLQFAPSIIPPGADIPQLAVLNTNGGFIRERDLREILELRTRVLWLCGVIRYEDAFKPEPIHETRFCYYYETRTEGRDPFFHLGGPPEYNKTT